MSQENSSAARVDQIGSQAEFAILMAKRQAEANGKKFRLKQPTRQMEPRGLERDAQRRMGELIDRIAEILRRFLIPELPGLVAAARFESPQVDALHYDQTIAERIAQLMAAVRGEVTRTVTDEEIAANAAAIGTQIDGFNRAQVTRTITSVLGVPLISQDGGFSEAAVRSFIEQNTSLIRNVSDEFLAGTQETVLRGIRRGTRHEEIAKQILGDLRQEPSSRFRKAKTRASLIARDQVNKLNGKLSRDRQVSVGLKSYIWRTARDERVRPEHAAREGRRFLWTRPPFDGHPGEPINCRCFAEPVFADLI